MNKKIKLFSLLALLIGQFVSVSAQENKIVKDLSLETPLISGGAEHSIFLEKQKKLGDKSIFYNRKIEKTAQSPATINAATAITTIEGINFDENAANNGGSYSIPPDPSGAIGINHLVSVTNTSIEWFSKAGTQLNSQSLASFFASLAPLTDTFDPKVLFDQYNERFVVVTLERVSLGTTSSRILIAVTQSADPTGTWYFQSINSQVNISGVDYWADYPGFAVGTDAIYITNNMFSHAVGAYGGTRLWTVAKTGLYTGGTSIVNIYDPFSAGGLPSTLQPAHMFGTPPTGVGTYLVGRNTSGGNRVLQLFTVSSTSSITFSGYINIGSTSALSLTLNDAPQMGTTQTIETNDSRLYNAVWRNNLLYTATVFAPSTGVDVGQTTVHWMQVNTTTNTMSDQGNIGGEDIAVGTHTFFPSIAVNRIGEMMVGFAASASTIYPGAYYTFRFPYDAPGTVQSSKTLRAGDDYYDRRFGGPRNRWGDYSGSSVDPTNDLTFCLFNEYAMTRGTLFSGEDGRYGTVFGIMPRLKLTVLLEGPFNSSTTIMDQNLWNQPFFPLNQPFNTPPWNYQGLESIPYTYGLEVDWILVTLRKGPDPLTAVDVASRAAFISKFGIIMDWDGAWLNEDIAFTVEPGDYWVVVQHRNHLPIMSSTQVTIN